MNTNIDYTMTSSIYLDTFFLAVHNAYLAFGDMDKAWNSVVSVDEFIGQILPAKPTITQEPALVD